MSNSNNINNNTYFISQHQLTQAQISQAQGSSKRQSHGAVLTKFKPHFSNNSTSPQNNNRYVKPIKQNYHISSQANNSNNLQYSQQQSLNQNNGSRLNKIILDDKQIIHQQRIGAYSSSPKNNKLAMGLNVAQGKMFIMGQNQEYNTIAHENSRNIEVPSLSNLKSQNQNYIMMSQELKKTPQSTKNLAQSSSKIIFPNPSNSAAPINSTHQINNMSSQLQNMKEITYMNMRGKQQLQQNDHQSNVMNLIKRRVSQEQSNVNKVKTLNKSGQSLGSQKAITTQQQQHQEYLLQQQQQVIKSPSNMGMQSTKSLNSANYQEKPNSRQLNKRQSVNSASSKELKLKHIQLKETKLLTQSHQIKLWLQLKTYGGCFIVIKVAIKAVKYGIIPIKQANSTNQGSSKNFLKSSKDSQSSENMNLNFPVSQDIQTDYYQKNSTNVKLSSQIKDIARQLWVAAEIGDQPSIIRILKSFNSQQNQVQINCTNSDGWTPLHVAASEGHTHIVEILIQQGANIECKTKSQRTPLHIACIRGNLGVVQTLVQAGGDTNSKDVDGNTPAHFCAEYGHHDCLRFLLTKHPTLFAKNKEGKSPIDLSVSNEVLMTFEEYIQSAKHFLYAKDPPQSQQIQQQNQIAPVQQQQQSSRRQTGQVQDLKINKAIERLETNPLEQQQFRNANSKQIQIHVRQFKFYCLKETNGQKLNIQKKQTFEMSVDMNLSSRQKTQAQQIQVTNQQQLIQAPDFSKTQYSTISNVAQNTMSQFSSGPPVQVVEEKEEFRLGPSMFIPLKMLGSGSFGEVYLVKEKFTSQLFAMKILNKSKIMGQNLVRYAKTERNVLSYTRHPFIVNLNYAFQTNTKLFLILDFCPGGDLGKILQRERKFTEDRARIYAAEILLALEDLHKRDIIYRDLKPDNVVLDYDGHAQLTDFGLSKEGVEEVSKGAKSFCGSVAYLAPEMLRRAGHGKSVDWYLFGVLIYEMVVGCPPYFSPKKEELFNNIQKGVLKIPASLSEECKNLIVSLLNRNPSKRLGAGPEGCEEIKAHSFFEGMDWKMAKDKKLQPPKPEFNAKFLNQLQSLNEAPDESLLKVFEDFEELDPDIFENKTVEGWSFIQGVGTIIHQHQD
eukprot:403355646